MEQKPPTGRPSFQPSGKVNWVRFLPWAALALAAGTVLALVMFLLFTAGFYLVIIVPFFAAAGLAGLVMLAVAKGHCRSRLLGGSFGVLAGLVVYLGYYYVCMVHDLGAEFASRVELVPQYIWLRIQTDVVRDVGAPDKDGPEKNPRAGQKYFNGAFFAIELGALLLLPSGAGLRRAGRAYCEKCSLWMQRESSTFQPEVGPGIVEALRIGSVQSLAALFTSPLKPAPPHAAAAVEYCPNLKGGRTSDCPVYLSVKQVVQLTPAMNKDAFENAKGKVIARQIRLTAAETPALLPRFASLESATGTTAAAVLQEMKISVPAPQNTVCVDIQPVDPQYAGKVWTTRTKLIANGIMLLLLLGIFGSIGLGFLGGWLAFPDHPPPGGVAPAVKLLGEIIIGVALLLAVAMFTMVLTAPGYFSTRYLRGLIRREFARRPGHLVGCDDPQAHFVEISPRANWGKLQLDDASDVGFLRLDLERGEVLFEGDNEYIRIPAASITSCEIERFVAGEGTEGATTYYRLVVQANHRSGFWEAPFGPRGGTGKFRRKKREKWARDMEQQIKGMMRAVSQPI